MISLFFNKTVYLNEEAGLVADDGTYSVSYMAEGETPRGSFQPMSASEAVKYGREAGAILANLYLPTLKTDGTAMNVRLYQTVYIDSQTWRIIGPPISDPYNQGVIKVVIEMEA